MPKYEEKWGAKTEPIAVVAYLDSYRIEGTMFRLPTLRVSDAVNQATEFLSLKDAVVYGVDSDAPLLQKPFLAIHKSKIVFITERE
jgi:hypothetical protein